MKKQILIMSLAVFLIIAASALASAEYWKCFDKGEKIDYCNPKTEDRTAPNDDYMLCMSSFNESKQCYNQGNWLVCNTLPQECSGANGNAELDVQPPIMIIKNPQQSGLYDKKSVLIEIELNEKGSIYYQDNLISNPGWKKLCVGCSNYHGLKSFSEGNNNITFKATDIMGNYVNRTLTFFIDSKKPKIKKTSPKKGFTNGLFEIEIQEANPKSLILNYGIYGDYKTESINLKNCAQIKGSSDKLLCKANVNSKIKAYEGQNIEYWVSLEDIVGTKIQSKRINLSVDTTPPIINKLNVSIYKQTASFSINITEKNFDEAGYSENISGKIKYTKLCSSLKNGLCDAKKTFSAGNYTIDLQVRDKAGNAISKKIEIKIA